MKDILVGTWKREDTYRGHSKINHYHCATELRCYVCDCSKEREMGITVNGKPAPDYYDIIEVNHLGEVIYRHHYTDRDKANECFLNLLRNIGGFQKV